MRPKMRAASLAAGALCIALSASACSGAGGGTAAGDQNSINVLMVNNPQMEDLQRLTADNFTKDTGIKVNYTVLPENDVRAKISQEFSSQAGQYDVASLSNYEIPFYSENKWLAPLDNVAKDAEFNQADILPAYTASLTGKDGKLYGEPFYGESSFLMYRKDIFDAKGLTMPEKPTWDQVADLAAKADGAAPGMKGICLRGQPGWGQVFAPLTTVVNTFGGTWFDKDWNAQVNSPEFTEATQFYIKLVREHGEAGAAQAGFTECLNNMSQSKVAMWYDATSAAGALEADALTREGKDRLRPGTGEEDRSPPAGCGPGPGACRLPPRSRMLPGSSSPGPAPRSTRSSWPRSWAGPRFPPASASPPTRTPSSRRPPRSSRRNALPSRTRIRRIQACRSARSSASSSSASPSSPTWAPPSPRVSAPPLQGRDL